MEQGKSPIETVLVIPRNLRFCSYFVNGNDEEHAMHYDDIREYLIDLVPQQAKTIIDYVASRFNFVVFVNQGEVRRLTVEDETTLQQALEQAHKELYSNIANKKREVEKKKSKTQTFLEKTNKLLGKLGQQDYLTKKY